MFKCRKGLAVMNDILKVIPDSFVQCYDRITCYVR